MNSFSEPTGEIRWNPDAVRHMDADVEWALTSNPSGPAEVAGLLLGKPGPPFAIIDAQPVFLIRPSDRGDALIGSGKRLLERTIAWSSSARQDGLSVVGFYRSHMGPQFAWTEEDLELIRTAFRAGSRVAVLIKVTGIATSGVQLCRGENAHPLYEFQCSNGRAGMPRWLELWQQMSRARETEHLAALKNGVTESPQADIPQGKPIGEIEQGRDVRAPVRPVLDAISTSRSSFRLLPFVPAALILAFVVVFLSVKGPDDFRPRAHNSRGTLQPIQREGSVDSKLGLRARRDGEDLRLDWNHGAPVLAGASGAVLTIREANAQDKTVTINGELLRRGTVVYRPVEGDVSLDLVIFGQSGAKLAESVARFPERVSDRGE
ncbi:MAG: hypothetical protein ACJ74Z_23590 [Bryobacteraceae bacterium]